MKVQHTFTIQIENEKNAAPFAWNILKQQKG